MRGRKPLPIALRKLHGADRSKLAKIAKYEPESLKIPKDYPIPKHLSAEAKQEWRKKFPYIRTIGLTCDLELFTCWCDAVGTFHIATRELNKSGPVYLDGKGNLRRHPWVSVRSTAVSVMLSLAGEFGFGTRHLRRLPKA
jgi:P27 family predicted phage terminase small subunit